MPNYITRTDIDNLFGSDNVNDWSNRNQDGVSGNTTVINQAIADAEERIDNKFRRSEYTVPISGSSGVPERVKFWSAVYAGQYLRNHRDISKTRKTNEVDTVSNMVMEVDNEIFNIINGPGRLDAGKKHSQPTAPVVI